MARVFSGAGWEGNDPEVVEGADHPWFIGVQFAYRLKAILYSGARLSPIWDS
jgi:CTP synthase (UTP-ammonia lyase)